MKKLLLLAAIAVFGLTSLNAQNVQFGAAAGLLSVDANAKINGQSLNVDSEIGFYIGAIADISISDEFHLQPELLFANVNDGNGLLLPIMAKYYASENFFLQAGPQFDFSLEDIPNDYTGLGISLAAGLGYDINENIFVEAKYSFQVNNYYTGNMDIESKSNLLLVGVGYKFN